MSLFCLHGGNTHSPDIPIPELALHLSLDAQVSHRHTKTMARSRLAARCPLLSLLFLLTATSLADCYPFSTANDHLGEVTCIRGKVVKLVVGPTGLHFLNFCEDYKNCPFTVGVFPRDLRDVGDVRTLAGKEIEVTEK